MVIIKKEQLEENLKIFDFEEKEDANRTVEGAINGIKNLRKKFKERLDGMGFDWGLPDYTFGENEIGFDIEDAIFVIDKEHYTRRFIER